MPNQRLSLAMWLVIATVPTWSATTADGKKICPPAIPNQAIFTSSEFNSVVLLLPPPSLDPVSQQADLDAVLATQKAARAAGTVQRALDDTELNCARFKDVLGPELKSAAAKNGLAVINQGARGVIGAINPAKDYWKRPRPYIVSKQVEALGDVAPDGEMSMREYPEEECVPAPPKDEAEAKAQALKKAQDRYEKDYSSYPSGHAGFGLACALLLTEVFPEKRRELALRGLQYGESRTIIGAHFPSDVRQGQVAATFGVGLVMQNARFARNFYEARAELRAALGYPAKVPDLEPNKDFFKNTGPAAAAKHSGGLSGAPPALR